jgi:serine/threonine protein kinase
MYFVHFQAQQGSAATLPGDVVIPAHPNRDLTELLRALLNADPTKRPTAAQAASAPYFTTSLLVEKEEAAALREALQAELSATLSMQHSLNVGTASPHTLY